jgi:toxin ParE1/3/4
MSGSWGSYSLRPRAEADLEEIWLYTRDRWSLEQAESYLRAMSEAFAGLASGSLVGRVSNVRNGYLKYAVGSHLIFYVKIADGVEVVRVLHERMDVLRHL